MRAYLAAVLLVMTTGVVVAGSLEEAKTANDKGDFRTAVRIYSEQSNQGDRTAQLQLGLMYDEGHGVPKHYQQAVRWYTVAASQGDPEAPYYLGRIYQAALPSFHEHGDIQNAPRKAETRNCRSRSQQSRRQTFRRGYSLCGPLQVISFLAPRWGTAGLTIGSQLRRLASTI